MTADVDATDSSTNPLIMHQQIMAYEVGTNDPTTHQNRDHIHEAKIEAMIHAEDNHSDTFTRKEFHASSISRIEESDAAHNDDAASNQKHALEKRILSIDEILSTFGKEEETGHDGISHVYTFHCTIADMRRDLLSILQGVEATAAMVEKYSADLTCLGSVGDLEWLVRLSWNLGTLMSTETACIIQQKCTISEKVDGVSSVFQSTEEMIHVGDTRCARLLVGAEFFEVSEALQRRLQSMWRSLNVTDIADRRHVSGGTGAAATHITAAAAVSDTEVQTQCYCLLTATALRLDYSTQRSLNCKLQHSKETTSFGIQRESDEALRENQFNSSTIALNLMHRAYQREIGQSSMTSQTGEDVNDSANQAQIEANLQGVRKLLDSNIEFEVVDMNSLRKTTLQLEFASICKKKDNALCEKFLTQRQTELLQLSAKELQACKNMLEREGGGSVDCCRRILNFALQICTRNSQPDYMMMGDLYCQIIEISPSRQHALERVQDFVQLIQTMSASQRNNSVQTAAVKKSQCEGSVVNR